MTEKLWADFCAFARAQLATGDIDPTYPVLKRFYKAEGLSLDQALWRTLLYVTFYHLGSAAYVWQRAPDPRRGVPFDVLDGRATGIERRGFRGIGNDKAWRNLQATLERVELTRFQTLGCWLGGLIGAGGGTKGWDNVRRSFEAIPGNGPWASYKWADLLKHVHDFPITASDIGVGGAGKAAGPIPGMVKLTGHDWKRCAEDVGLQRELLRRAHDDGVPFEGLDQLETALCDFNSLCKGSYYVGHDIDQQMTQLAEIESGAAGLWEARAESFPPEMLGETDPVGWFGVRKRLKTFYRDTGSVLFAR